MTKDKAIEELFLVNKPVFSDNDEFMLKLERKLQAVEYIKKYEEANLRRYKYAILFAFFMGLMSGGTLLFFALRSPMDIPLFSFNVSSGLLFVIQQNSRLIVSVMLMLFISYGIISIVGNVMDITKTINASRKPYKM